jgi:hypothetical protein
MRNSAVAIPQSAKDPPEPTRPSSRILNPAGRSSGGSDFHLERRNEMTVKPIPAGHHSVTPYLSIKGAADAIEFYKRAFSATELFRLAMPSGDIGHAEMKIGDSPIMLADPGQSRLGEINHNDGGRGVFRGSERTSYGDHYPTLRQRRYERRTS